MIIVRRFENFYCHLWIVILDTREEFCFETKKRSIFVSCFLERWHFWARLLEYSLMKKDLTMMSIVSEKTCSRSIKQDSYSKLFYTSSLWDAVLNIQWNYLSKYSFLFSFCLVITDCFRTEQYGWLDDENEMCFIFFFSNYFSVISYLAVICLKIGFKRSSVIS